MIDISEQAIASEVETRKKQNKHRLEFLAAMLAISSGVGLMIALEYKYILGQLSHLTGTDGQLSGSQVGVARPFINSGLQRLARDIVQRIESADSEVAGIAAKLAGVDYDFGLNNVVRDSLAMGALGVPFAAVVAQEMVKASNNVTGAIQRTILAGEPVVAANAAINAAMNETLRKKLQGEVETQLNTAFNKVVRYVAKEDKVKGMIYHLSPTDAHCNVCPPRDGKIFPVNDPVWASLPEHNNCICWGEPVFNE